MSTTFVQYVGDGSNRTFNVPFPYIESSHVKVKLGPFPAYEGTHYDFITAGSIQIRPQFTPSLNTTVEIRRQTHDSTALVTYQNGAVLSADDLNTATLQALFISQEIKDYYEATVRDGLVRLNNGTAVSAQEAVDAAVQTVLDSALLAELQSRIGDIDSAAETLLDHAAEILANANAIADNVLDTTANAAAITANTSAITSLQTAVDALSSFDGTGLATLIASETTARIAGDSALASTLSLIGAASPGGTSFVLDLSKVIVDGSTALGTRLTGIDTRFSTNESALATETTARTTADSALSSSITSLSATVSSNYSTLNSAISSESTARASGDSANATLITTLTARVDTAEGNISSNAAAISSEASARATGDSANASSITTLAARVTTAEGNIADNAAAITSEASARATGDSANASSITTLAARVTTAEGNITSNAAAISTEATARASGDSANASSITTLAARVTTAEGNITSNAAAISSEASARASGDSAIASDVTTLAARVTTAEGNISSNTAAISSEATARASGDSANASSITTLAARVTTAEGNISSNTAAISSEASTRASAVSAVASDVTTLTSRVTTAEGNISTASTQISANTSAITTADGKITSIIANYMVKTDVNGYIAGFGLYNTGASSDFIVLADKFAVVTPGNTPKVPFSIVGGVVYMQNVVIAGDLLVGGTITAGKLKTDEGVNINVVVPGSLNTQVSAYDGTAFSTTGMSSQFSKVPTVDIAATGQLALIYIEGLIKSNTGGWTSNAIDLLYSTNSGSTWTSIKYATDGDSLWTGGAFPGTSSTSYVPFFNANPISFAMPSSGNIRFKLQINQTGSVAFTIDELYLKVRTIFTK